MHHATQDGVHDHDLTGWLQHVLLKCCSRCVLLLAMRRGLVAQTWAIELCLAVNTYNNNVHNVRSASDFVFVTLSGVPIPALILAASF